MTAKHDPGVFRLRAHEPVAGGLRRIVRAQLDDAAGGLSDVADEALGKAVHDARKRLKRARAVVRLVRDQLGPDVFRHENIALRDVGRRMSAVRDAQVLVDTLEGLVARHAAELPEHAFARLRAKLAAERDAAHNLLRADLHVNDELLRELAAARERISDWSLPGDMSHGDLAHGFERIYRRGRKAVRRAARHAADTKALHEVRKRAKDLWHAAQVAAPVDRKRMKRLARRAHELADLVGEDHDLAVLREAASARRATLTAAERKDLLRLIDRRRRKLQRRALKRARRLFRAKPRKLAGVF